jgi:hypothetical protein
MRTTHWIPCAIIVASVALMGCSHSVAYQNGEPDVVVASDHEPGPPPQAPAHGYRSKRVSDDVVLEYDSDLDVYVVTGYADTYYTAGQYFRIASKVWQWSVDVEGPWKPVEMESDLPHGLRNMDMKVSKNNKK